MGLEEMISNKGKRAVLICFAFLFSYIISFMLDPYDPYWHTYFERPATEILFEWGLTFTFSATISEVSLLLDRFFNKRIPWTINPKKRLLIQGVTQIVVIILIIFLFDQVYNLIAKPQQPLTIDEWRGYFQWITVSILIALMISAINTGNFLLVNWKRTAMEAAEHKIKIAEHKQIAAEAELQALKLQLDPHFVFNNLSVLSELIQQDQTLGYQYAENFAKVYRYLLVNSKNNLIQLEEELKFLNAYIFLVKKRIGDGVIFEINIEKSKLHLQIPPLTLQLFIENALKHNQTVKSNPLLVQIFTNTDDELVVVNSRIPRVNTPISSGIGLKNIASRYALFSERKPKIESTELSFTAKVPLIA